MEIKEITEKNTTYHPSSETIGRNQTVFLPSKAYFDAFTSKVRRLEHLTESELSIAVKIRLCRTQNRCVGLSLHFKTFDGK